MELRTTNITASLLVALAVLSTLGISSSDSQQDSGKAKLEHHITHS